MNVLHAPDQKASAGFTLVEAVVIITIISILTALSVFALPEARHNQRLVTDSERIQAALRSAERYAINEVRTDECLEYVGNDSELRRRCSNVGIALQGKKLVTFADTTGNQTYTEGSDFLLSEQEISTELEGDGAWRSFVFEATPPTIYTYADGAIISPQISATITLRSGKQTRTLEIHPYGRVEIKNS